MPQHAKLTGLVVSVIACTGLDPGAFSTKRSPPNEPDAAGWAFDAGAEPDAGGRSTGGRAGPATGGTGGSAVRPTSGRGGASDAGAPDEGGASGAEPDGTGGVTSGAGAGGVHGAGAGRGGALGGAGTGGRASSGAAGDAGSTGARGGAGGGAGQGGQTATHALYFSEYVEGSSSYKALELTAREASSFTGCRLVTYFNGSSSGSGIALDGAIPAGGAYVLCSTALATLLGSVCHRATNLTFNGDDAVALECDGVALDVIGQIGVDPGDAWGSGDASTLNHTLRRSCSSISGDRDGSDAFDPASQWSALAVDTFDGLGHAECTGES